MVLCYGAVRTDGHIHQAALGGPAVDVRAHPSILRRTAADAWEVCKGAEAGYTMMRWEWHGEIDIDGCWMLLNPQLV